MEIIVIHLRDATLMHSQAKSMSQLAEPPNKGENPSFLSTNVRNLAGFPWMALPCSED
jgi:hypothetical protein